MIESFAPMDEEASADLRYRLRSMPRIRLEELADGPTVKVRGYVASEETLISPVTGTPCSLYAVEWREPQVPSFSLWMTVWESLPDWEARSILDGSPAAAPHLQVGGHDLLLDDGTGQALVRVDRARTSLLGVWKSARVRDVVRDRSGQPGGLLRSSRKLLPDEGIEHREAVVARGTLLTILGRATYEANPGPAPPRSAAAASYRASHGQWVFAASASSPLFIVQELISSLDAVG